MTAHTKNTPPANVDAERSALGAILINPDCFDAVAAEFVGLDQSRVFFDDAHAEIWQAMREVVARATPLDEITILDATAARPDTCVTASLLAALSSAVPTSANAVSYARIVAERYQLRALQRFGFTLANSATREGADVAALLQSMSNEVSALNRAAGKGPVCVADGLENAVERIVSLFETKSTGGLLTGLGNLDAILNGLDTGAVCVIAARPSVGKTALACNIAANVAQAGGHVLIHSLEMAPEALIQRMTYSAAKLEKDRVLGGYYSREVLLSKLQDAVRPTHFARIHIDGQRRLTHFDLSTKAKAFKRERPQDLLIIDYLQLMTPTNPKAQREAQVAEASREIKILAEVAGCPVIVLSQLSRAAEHDGTPSLAHLRESGAIEQDADVVVLLSRGEGNVIAVNVAKNRNGSTGTTGLYFDRATQTFRDWTGNAAELRGGSTGQSKGFRKATAAPAVELTYDEDPNESF